MQINVYVPLEKFAVKGLKLGQESVTTHPKIMDAITDIRRNVRRVPLKPMNIGWNSNFDKLAPFIATSTLLS